FSLSLASDRGGSVPMYLNLLRLLGRKGLNYCRSVGRASILLSRSLLRLPQRVESFHLLCRQIYMEGCLSLVIIMVSALFIGMVVGLQGYNTLDKFGATDA